MVTIYVLRLAKGKYYVGRTTRLAFRLNDHWAKGGGSVWTKMYPPKEVEALYPGCDVFDEDKITLKYMSKHGITNVRGGSFCQSKLPPDTRGVLERMLQGASDKCYNCGETGHFVLGCPQRKRKKEVRTEKAASVFSSDSSEEESPGPRRRRTSRCSSFVSSLLRSVKFL